MLIIIKTNIYSTSHTCEVHSFLVLGVRSSEFGVRSSEFGVRSSEFGVRSSEARYSVYRSESRSRRSLMSPRNAIAEIMGAFENP
ncbi:Cytosine deaminase [Crocosphaera watsonii WH 8502]|uniref:Cytosine deaminase n=1 Tax=Crocosphaera watsonii WH 8502 TaxID=423474 RepID=T2I6P8_CROWT|nr:Cytosine deaminase [Crocosphaera watsonii WH 8502]